MKRPSKNASEQRWAAYRQWVKDQLKDWDPADDKGGPDTYVPRYDGVKAEGIEGVKQQDDNTVPKIYKEEP